MIIIDDNTHFLSAMGKKGSRVINSLNKSTSEIISEVRRNYVSQNTIVININLKMNECDLRNARLGFELLRDISYNIEGAEYICISFEKEHNSRVSSDLASRVLGYDEVVYVDILKYIYSGL